MTGRMALQERKQIVKTPAKMSHRWNGFTMITVSTAKNRPYTSQAMLCVGIDRIYHITACSQRT
jgi:hypothetical protein